MFDTTIVKQSPQYPQTIHNHNAPTGDVLRLLEELTDKAEARVLERFTLKNNHMECACVAYEKSIGGFEKKLRISIKINGKMFNFDITVDMWEVAVTRRDNDILLKVHDILSKEIASQVLHELI